jgi:hypothetical protein
MKKKSQAGNAPFELVKDFGISEAFIEMRLKD